MDNYIGLKMKRGLALILLFLGGIAYAQQSKTDETLEFNRHWSIGIQGGVAHTIGEGAFSDLLSPAAQISASWNFHHAMALRLGVSGWQGKGLLGVSGESVGYNYKFGQLNADYVLNLAGIFGGYNHKRVVNPYVLAGVGAVYGFSNSEADAHKDRLDYYWEAPKFFFPVRAGLGVDFRLSRVVSLGIEGNVNMLSDRFNSKVGYNPDWQINLLAGLKFNLGKTTKTSQAYADRIAAEEAAKAAALAAEKAEAERLAAEKAAREAAERAEAERLAAEKAAREAAERAMLERDAICKQNSDNIYFTIGSAVIRGIEAQKVRKLADWMMANEDYKVTLVGYADKLTGTTKRNMILSQMRAEAVKDALIEMGINPDRITTDHKGDTIQPFGENIKNRVVVCTLK